MLQAKLEARYLDSNVMTNGNTTSEKVLDISTGNSLRHLHQKKKNLTLNNLRCSGKTVTSIQHVLSGAAIWRC
jgi:hypothetical protein